MSDDRSGLIERGFQLAYFIVPDRIVAIGILIAAMNKLQAQIGREKKRTYWRDKYMKRWITSVTRDDADILQWLIYQESDAYEKQQGQSGKVSTRALIIRYIKHIVQMTTAMSSFYVSVGVSRLLYGYDTSETQRMYELVSERYPGADQFRRAKSLLMDKLDVRFGKVLKTFRSQHGEARYETLPDQSRWAELARKCLAIFTPWSTLRTCLAQADSLSARENVASLSSAPQSKIQYDTIEMNRCHAFIDPMCFRRLVRSIGFPAPDQKLALPQFFLEREPDESESDDPPSTRPLTAQEHGMIRDRLSHEAARRRRASPQSLRILVNGNECARLDLRQECARHFEVAEDAKLFEIWGHADDGDYLLATHVICYDDSQGCAPLSATVPLKNAGKLVFTLAPQTNDTLEAGHAFVSLHYFPAATGLVWTGLLRSLLSTYCRAVGYAIVGVALVAMGWFASGIYFRRELMSQQVAMQQMREQLNAPKTVHVPLGQYPGNHGPGQTIASYKLAPDDLNTRGQEGLDIPSIFVASDPGLVYLVLPIGKDGHRFYRATLKSFLGSHEIFTENMLAPTQTASGPAVIFTLVSSFVKDNNDYTIVLSALNAADTKELNTFTFHVANHLAHINPISPLPK